MKKAFQPFDTPGAINISKIGGDKKFIDFQQIYHIKDGETIPTGRFELSEGFYHFYTEDFIRDDIPDEEKLGAMKRMFSHLERKIEEEVAVELESMRKGVTDKIEEKYNATNWRNRMKELEMKVKNERS